MCPVCDKTIILVPKLCLWHEYMSVTKKKLFTILSVCENYIFLQGKENGPYSLIVVGVSKVIKVR